MKKLALLFTLFALTQTANAAYKIKAELEMANRVPNSGSIVVEEGKAATVSFGNTEIRLQPKKNGSNTVFMSGRVFKVENGVKTLIAESSIVTELGKPGEISTVNEDGDLIYRLRLTPTLKQ